ncbi:MAG: aldo/keto reductase [Deltaproteobacteria bacterium]|jgi:predicted aldo/keto reductase-like oxidoreductase|nr:aldo/keto reductase [Deltaproteobacteria bacterium]
METRDFGYGDISLLGFGFMRLPVKGTPAEIDIDLATEMVDLAIESGVNYFDTAYMYHNGESENFAGRALSRHDRSSYKLASKMPLLFLKEKSDLDKFFNEQLKKCRVDYFDFYMIHGITRNLVKLLRDLDVYDYVLRKKKEGRVKHIGFSFHDTPELLDELLDEHPYDFAQIQLNYVDWELQRSKTLYETLAAKKIPVIVMEPIRGGTLANPCAEAVEIFKKADPDSSPASWALRYAASLPGVQTVLSGMTTPEQLRDNLKTMKTLKPVTAEDQKVIDAALLAFNKAANIPCTACRYCMDCPEGVEIPRNLGVFNNYERLLSEKHPWAKMIFKMEYDLLKTEERAQNCVSCGECVKHCPQHIDIPHFLSELDKLEKSAGAGA